MKNLLVVALLLIATITFAQKGKIRGQVIDASNGEPLFGATALIKGTTNGNITDFDGKFSIDVEPGTYTVVISYVSFDLLRKRDTNSFECDKT